MSLKFDQLPFVVLEGIFKCANSDELFDLCFLNKSLFRNVSHVITYNLVYSVYFFSKVKKYQQYQKKFIKENGLSMRRLYIFDGNFQQLAYCPNITSLDYLELTTNDSDSKGNINQTIFPLTKLKNMIIFSNNYIQSLSLLANYLNQIENFQLVGFYIEIKEVVKYLNPKKLKCFILTSEETLDIDGLAIIKADFVNLQVLQLRANETIISPTTFNCTISFNSNLDLEIKGHIDNNVIQYFGNLRELKSVKLIDSFGSFFSMNQCNAINLLNSGNVIALGHANSNNLFNKAFLNLITLREVSIKELTFELLKSISLLLNIQNIQFKKLSNLIEHACKRNVINIGLTKSHQYKFIKKIKMESYRDTFARFSLFLSMFPNLEVIRIEKFTLLDSNEQINYTPTILLLVIAPIKNEILCREVEKNSMISWYKIET
ncbi:hypothetical protein K502DRAFT_358124 [Neoconidiobolus thromboides FSU 785]|nr:hypothetical protein K502DRAFT_358124 [Neoconidiobolus thromboides FSU 785]